MLSETQRIQLNPAIRTMQIIVGALVLGVVNFMAVVVFVIRPQAQEAGGELPLLTYLAVGFAVLGVLASIVVPAILAGSLRKSMSVPQGPSGPVGTKESIPIGPLLQMYQTLLIIRCALLEGAAFFCLVAHMIERQTITLAAAGVLLLVLLSQFPTRSRVESWIENEQELFELRQQLR